MQFERYFRLADAPGSGVCCGSQGLFVGDTPMLEQAADPDGHAEWRPRPLSDLDRDLAKAYGLPVEFNSKIGGLATVARGDLAHAQIATLLLQIPDPPALTKSDRTPQEVLDLARALQAGGLLERDWDPMKHPRWPAHSPGGVGGEFAPRAADVDSSEPGGFVIQAQTTIPFPLDVPVPPIPLPSEIVPPIVVPDNLPRSVPQNPYPSRPQRVKEWQDAFQFCWDLKTSGQLGRGAYRGMGKRLRDCMLGQVSESCGGNATSA